MRLFIDTDVLLDVLLAREPHLSASSVLLDWASAHPGKAAVSWHGLANVHYLCEGGAEDFIHDLLHFCEVPATGTSDMLLALDMDFKDLEDALQTAAALKFNAQLIVTRNVRDYRKAGIAVKTPADVLSLLE